MSDSGQIKGAAGERLFAQIAAEELADGWIVVWQCSDIEQRWAMAISEQQRLEHEQEIDEAIEAELGSWPSMGGGIVEETEVELVPVELLGFGL